MAGDGGTGGEAIEKVEYDFLCDDGPDAQWRVYRLQFWEGINRLFELNLDLVTSDVNADTTKLLGGSSELVIRRGAQLERSVFGIVAEVEYLGVFGDELMMRVRVVPAAALAKQNMHTRMFQDMPVLDIVKEVLEGVLGPYNRTHDPGTAARGTEPRDYCVQYGESDFDFVARLLEEEGISYHFVHDPDVGHEVMKFTYANDDFEDTANVDGSPIFPIIVDRAELIAVESLRALGWKTSLLPTAALRQDFDFKTPMEPLFATPSGGADDRGRERRLYHHMRRRYITDDVDARTKDHFEAASMEKDILRGQSNATAFKPGMRFELERHGVADLERPYVLTRVMHVGYCADARLSTATGNFPDDTPRYENRFECVPSETPVRPLQQTRKPRVYGPETGIVAGPSGEEIHTDEFGRIKVQFHWEEEPTHDDTSSCWIPVAQSWAGPSWGAQFIPRIGMEVVVSFLEGNPDRPLVTGCVYNGDNAPPFALPDSKTQSGWRTNSSLGGGGSNEFRFEDAAGSEEVYLHAQKDWNNKVENNRSTTIGANDTLSVGGNRDKTVTKDQTETVKGNKTIDITKDHKETINGTKTETVVKDITLTGQANQKFTLTGNLTEKVSGKADRTIEKTKKEFVLLKCDEIVGAMKSVKVGGLYSEQVGASRSITAVGAMTFTAGLSGKFQCAKDITIKAQKKMGIDAGAEMTILSKKKMSITCDDNQVIVCKKKATINANEQLTIAVGQAKIVMKKNGDITVEGKKINVKGSGDVIIKGSSVKLN